MARIAAPILANQVLAAVSAIFTWGMREELTLRVSLASFADTRSIISIAETRKRRADPCRQRILAFLETHRYPC